MDVTTIDDFYKDALALTGTELGQWLPKGITEQVGHFNVFDVASIMKTIQGNAVMPYNRRAYYKIGLIDGHNIADYADKTIEIKESALMFGTPKIPYNWVPQDTEQAGFFCVFTADFFAKSSNGIILDDLPIYKPGGYPCFHISEEDKTEIGTIFRKMQNELNSDYSYKYDLIRNYIAELIHYGQKLHPAIDLYHSHNASARVASLFTELVERQFPISSPQECVVLRTAQDYADRLSIHVNYLNRALKEQTGHTTKNLISKRITQEAKTLLKHTNWNISEIAYSLGFEEVAHFSNFFKRQTSCSPRDYRN